MSLTLQLIILTALWCNSFHFLCEPGEILGKLGDIIRRWPTWIAKPILTCINCMASIHSLIVMVVFGWSEGFLYSKYMKQYFVVALCSVFLNGLLYLIWKNAEATFFKRHEDENHLSELEQKVDLLNVEQGIMRWLRGDQFHPPLGIGVPLRSNNGYDFGTLNVIGDEKIFSGVRAGYLPKEVEWLYDPNNQRIPEPLKIEMEGL